jgi:hypothetical protein
MERQKEARQTACPFGKNQKKLIEARGPRPAGVAFICRGSGRKTAHTFPGTAQMKNKKTKLPPAYAAETKDARLAGTFEVLVPVPDRNKPHKVPLQFQSLNEAEAWLHSAEGKETVAGILDSYQGK